MSTMLDNHIRQEIDSRQLRRAGRYGWAYGFGFAVIADTTFVSGLHGFLPAALLFSIATGATFPSLTAHILRWMEEIRQNTR